MKSPHLPEISLKKCKLYVIQYASPISGLWLAETFSTYLLESPGYKNLRDQSFQEIVDHMHVFIPCVDFTELSPLQKVQFLIGDTCYYFNQEWGDFFSQIHVGKRMFKRVYVCQSSVLNIDWNIFNILPELLSIFVPRRFVEGD